MTPAGGTAHVPPPRSAPGAACRDPDAENFGARFRGGGDQGAPAKRAKPKLALHQVDSSWESRKPRKLKQTKIDNMIPHRR